MTTKRSLEARIAQLDNQKKTLEARLARQNRARDTRRKVLLGALSLYRIEQGDTEHEAWVRQSLPGFLTRETDHGLFEDLLGDTVDGKEGQALEPANNPQAQGHER